MQRGTETLTVIRKAKVDRLRPAAGPTVEHVIEQVIAWPRSAREGDKGWVQIAGENVWCPALPDGSMPDITEDDQVRFRGQLYDVAGRPGDFVKRGRNLGRLANLNEVT